MRKVLISFSTLLLVMLISVGCNKNSPKDVATAWLTSFYHLDYDAAKKLSTDDTKNILSTLQQFTNMVPDSNKKEMKKVTVTVKDVKEEGDKATATYTTSNEAGKEQTLPLVKQGGKWLVQWSKNDMMGGAGAGSASDSTSGGQEQPAGGDSTNTGGGSAQDSTMH